MWSGPRVLLPYMHSLVPIVDTHQRRTPCLDMQACLAWWSTVSPYGGFGSTAALVFVLLVAGIKARSNRITNCLM